MNYSTYNAADFATDSFFIEWVKSPRAESNSFWSNYLENNPAKFGVVEEAKQLVIGLSQDEDELEEREFNIIWQNLQERREASTEQEHSEAKVISINFWQRKAILTAAAIGLLLLVSCVLWFTLPSRTVTNYATSYGNKQLITLTDHSKVILNGNSRLSYSEPLFPWQAREVELAGEAYFSVVHKQNNQPFTVHTPDNLRVEVLGTEFNVSQRGAISRVVLASGKVQVHVHEQDDEQKLVMKPGELVEVSSNSGGITKKEVNTEIYTSWKDNKLIFEDTPLFEILLMLEHNYGYSAIFQDKDLATKRLTASFQADGLETILSTLSETFNIKVEKQQNTILISH